MTSLSDRKALAAAVLSGILLFLSFPKFGFHAVAWFAFVPLFYALDRAENFRAALAAGFTAGMIFNVGIMYWISIVVVKYGYMPLWMGVSAMLLLAAALAAYFSLFATGALYLWRSGIPLYVAAPPLWVVVEFAKSHLFTGFPWMNLGYSQAGNLLLVQSADVFGVFGISFFVVLVNALVYHGLKKIPDYGKTAACAAACLAIVSSAMLYGYWRVQDINSILADRPEMKMSLIQGNIDQSKKWDAKFERESLDAFLRLTAAAPNSSPGLVIWPETATPFFFQDMDDKHRQITGAARDRNDYMILGSPSYVVKQGREKYMNSAFVLSNSGNIIGRYDKVHLVPFGEYVPLRWIFPFMGQVVPGMSDFLPGEGFRPVSVAGNRLGILICYESIFPEISREYRNAGAGLLVNITNDAWFDRSSAPYQHLSMAALRAVENRVYIARAANTGISAIISPTGQIVCSTGLFEPARLDGSIRFMDVKTLYSTLGDWPVLLICGLMLGASGIAVKKRKSARR